MEWIKSSNRLPNGHWLGCVKTDGGGADHFQTGDIDTIRNEMSMYKPDLHAFEPEWLDESDGWVKLEEGCEMPDYDHHVLWLCENGFMHVEALDKDGNPWLFESDYGSKEFRDLGNKATHWRELPPEP